MNAFDWGGPSLSAVRRAVRVDRCLPNSCPLGLKPDGAATGLEDPTVAVIIAVDF
jgi:hypothetical protein